MIRLLCTLVALVLPLEALAIEIQEVTSPGGIKAWLVEEHSIPFTAIDLSFTGGANQEASDRRGVTNLMTGLLEEGAADRDARAFAEAAESLAARMSFDASNDTVSVGMTFLTENRDESLALLRDALVEPRFDAPAVERVREQVLAGLASDARDPDEIAARRLAALSFPGHPYGTSMSGTPETVAAINIEDLRAAHARALTRDRVNVGVTGDITAEDLGPLLDELLGDLPLASAPEVPEADGAVDGGITVVDFPSPQSVVMFGQKGVPFDDPDYFPAFILNHILGGSGFDSRLMGEVREKRGLTYGIGTYLASRDLADQIIGQFSSSNDNTAAAIDIVRDEWARIATEGVTQEELDAAKTYLTGAYPLRFDGNSRIASILVGMQDMDLPIEYIDGRNDKVNAVTLDDVNRVAAKLLTPDRLHFVVVGQPEGIEPSSF
ncbi:M16 family metallopeptidase [Jannaschia rubra]|uniref:M16 family metallopeptidase n=1 Tax=Jannaschia rubra TaxID=282197 RepID=UPI0024918528|nr:pitrilysin family protein [Jannaschia rubra]